MTVYTAVERPRILAHLVEHPGLTAYEIAAALGYGKPAPHQIACLITQMWRKGVLVYDTAWRPHLGREARLWRIAPPGTPPPPRDKSAAAAEHRRERNRVNKQRQRARAAGLHVEPGARLHSRTPGPPAPAAWALPGDGACRDEDPDLFFPEPGEDDTKAKAVCEWCPIKAQCLALAITNREERGIWGGVNLATERQAHDQPSIASDPVRVLAQPGRVWPNPEHPGKDLTRDCSPSPWGRGPGMSDSLTSSLLGVLLLLNFAD
jgi:WhiB family transcriptional regulator, redox-sensing transcriptional regulator